jgi:ethanolamine utilization protein EutA
MTGAGHAHPHDGPHGQGPQQHEPHDHDPDHDHDRGDALESVELNPIWQQDNVTLHSVGVDIGSSGTQVAFSRLHLRRMGEDLTSRYVIVRRDTLFQSRVHLTPYLDGHQIDAGALGRMLDQAYQDAGQRPEEIDTGVVILTGEALRRRNAEQIAAVVSEQAGDLVCATAGHHMEAMLAAYGSGAARTSHEMSGRILNIDIGGGTTKLALIDAGRVVATAALHVGGRLQVVDPEGRITRLEPAAQGHAAHCGYHWSLGDQVEAEDLDRVAAGMADAVVAAVSGTALTPRVGDLFLTEPISDYGALDGLVFSGGVAEYVYGREERDFGDLGRLLGQAIRRRIEAGDFPAPLLPAGERIRATVLGASEYTVQLSGNTSFLPAAETMLPRRNLQVVRPSYELGEVVDRDAVATAVRRHLHFFDLADSHADVAVALSWEGDPDYPRLRAFAEGLARGVQTRLQRGLPLYLMVDSDIALTLGRLMRDELGLGERLLVLDGLALRDFDYVDLGRVRQPSNTVPVTIKSLLFGDGSEQ